MYYDGNFSVMDIATLYAEYTKDSPNMRVLKRYKVGNGYVALINMYGVYSLLFAPIFPYTSLEIVKLIAGVSETGAIAEVNNIATIIGAIVIAEEGVNCRYEQKA